MAVLDSAQLASLRQSLARLETAIDYDKPTVNAALQAIEDWFEANRSGIATAIDAATSPFVFSAARKRRLVKFYLLQKSGREAT